ncbi:MAG TPA: O-antigen ligase family protein [Bryobacteraceae bacterium]|nr:O-antigen ligase family protein [Bryobacteraceae bacterium]
MIALGLCILAFGMTRWAGKRSLGSGLVSLLLWGYLYGILRANLDSVFSHFLFDSALIGFYLAQKKAFTDPADARRTAALRYWTLGLMIWPALLLFLPFQPILVSLVGLRGCIFFIPMALLGSRLKSEDLMQLCTGLVCLNLLSLAFAAGEYFQGIERYYPYSAVTAIIYGSNDVAGGFFRIPGTFAHAHQYGGTMSASIPYLVGGWTEGLTRKARVLSVVGIGAAFLGILMSATRQNFILAAVMVLVVVGGTRMKTNRRVLFIVLIVGLVGVALTNERFQRFKSLGDTDYVGDRISSSVNRSFFEILFDYPMGNGLGGGGTSLPYFLEGQVRNPIGMENEYARILCEQGVIGFLLWLGFIVWYLSQVRKIFGKSPWASSRRLVFTYCLITLGIGTIGEGMLTAIPASAMLLLGMGWTSTAMRAEDARRRPVRRPSQVVPQPAWPAHAHYSG